MATRHHHLLSDAEHVAFYFASMLPGLIDIREQFPLRRTSGPHELVAYQASRSMDLFPGTIEIAERLGIKHPVARSPGDREFWVPTTDQLITTRAPSGLPTLRPIAVKATNELTKRERELLAIECEYWRIRGETWLLIAPATYSRAVAMTLRTSAPWAMCSERASNTARKLAVEVATHLEGHRLTTVLQQIQHAASITPHSAQCGFWQAVWNSELLIDLRRHHWPSQPIVLVSREQFIDFNPIAAGRSAWN